MNELLVAFITGLTTGGLSCLAVQGGLLASSIAHEVERTVASEPAHPAALAPAPTKKKQARTGKRPAAAAAPAATVQGASRATEVGPGASNARAARPIVLFLAAKVVAYTLLGCLLGWLGSLLQLTTTARVILQVGIGVFMVGTGLRMFNVHPIFRYFALEPLRFVTRYIRRKAKGDASAITPIFLGALTVLIPCGVTQAMMAVAMASGDAFVGGTTMLAFTLGTTPAFFALAYLVTRLGQRLEKSLVRVVAAVVLVLGLISIDAGLTLGGWPYSFTNLRMAATLQEAEQDVVAEQRGPHLAPGYVGETPAAPVASGASASNTTSGGAADVTTAFGPEARPGVVTVSVRNDGYYPQVLRAKANEPFQLALVTNEVYSCARAVVVPALRVAEMLPETGTVYIDVPAQPAGSRLFYTCSMGMYSGVIVFEG
jgi:sulfite exporter TauE/SafE